MRVRGHRTMEAESLVIMYHEPRNADNL
jgi:hypothetical protein